jgi:hypothetical protein
MPDIDIRIVSAPFPTKWNASKICSGTICQSLEGPAELGDGLENSYVLKDPLGWNAYF